MQSERLLFLFGPPGSGKNVAGSILEKEYGYHFYDADTDHTEKQKEAIRLGIPFTVGMRTEFFDKVEQKINNLMIVHSKLAVANAFINDMFRQKLLTRFPHATFVLLDADRETRVSRIVNRTGHHITADNAINMGDQFENINIPHTSITNNSTVEELKLKIGSFLEQYHLQNQFTP